jgi:23S rRNA U2552 (ribose-2'-O)-methylase RlmE/FtsJ
MKELEHNKISKRIFDRSSTSNAAVFGNTQDLSAISHNPASMHKYIHQHEIYGNDRYYGMTLINDDPICPGWKKTKTFLDANPNVIIETGEDKTGNLLSISNFKYCASKYKNKMELITADGGFDFSLDFNNQENIAIRLILAEVFFALAMQKKGGSFVLKIFDIFHKPTVDILYLLSYYYSNVSIIKPYTSRIANSEKYVICQNFKLEDSKLVIEEISRVFPYIIDGNSEIVSLLSRNHDLYYLNKIEEMNAILSFQQIDNISSTLSIITTHKNAEKIEQYKKLNIQKCISWCEKYNIPYFKQNCTSVSGGNIFLHRP